GYAHVESYGPFPIADDDSESSAFPGLAKTVFVYGVAGAVTAYAVQWFANVHSYALNIGGRPSHAVLAFMYPTLEGAMLFAGIAAAALLSAAVASVVSCSNRSNRERLRADYERMRQQQRVGAYSASHAFADGMAMRTPPAGTVSREEMLLGDSVMSGKRRGVYLSQPPVAITPQLLRAGAYSFAVYCAACHGDDGSG